MTDLLTGTVAADTTFPEPALLGPACTSFVFVAARLCEGILVVANKHPAYH